MAATQLPGGTVTFLFTDIEGSTKLLHELGEDGYAEALDAHRRVLREAVGRHDGVEVDTQGDAFFVAFPTAPGALEAAREAQSELEIPVRMGLHTGTPLLTAEGYVGADVHTAARIAAAGHGRQILVSSTSAALLDGDGLRDLGEHRLKDLSAPERIYQLGSEEFPALKTLYRTNLPIPATPFLGRERELAEIGTLLERDDVRLVTLLGPGGTGKTRLALQAVAGAADRYPDGVFWVSLAPLRDPALVLESATQALGAREGLVEHVADKRLLLLFDNFEHLMTAAEELASLLAACPNLSLVVTSRELLQLAAEQSFPVAPLDAEDGVQLFVARANAVVPGFEPDESVPGLCEQLDNLPLALELAAARVRILSPAQLGERLAQRLDLLKGGRDADPRQQTLRATIEWSHDLLTDDEQRLFARLAVFRGGCTLEAAEDVAEADLDTLQSLVDKSLLRHTTERFWMLETIREYARECLVASGEEADLRRRQALYVVDLLEVIVRAIEDFGDQAELVGRLAAEADNARAALEWARDHGEDEVLLRLVAALGYHWGPHGQYQEEEIWFPLALERGTSPLSARFVVLSTAADYWRLKRDYDRADAFDAERRLLAEEAGDELQLLAVMNSEARTAVERGDHERARAQFVALRERYRALGDRSGAANVTANLGMVALVSGDFAAGVAYSEEALEAFRELGDDGGIAVALINSGCSAVGLGDGARAERLLRDGLARTIRVEWKRGAIANIEGLGAAFVLQRDVERGAQLLGAAASLREDLGIDVNYEEMHDRAVADAKASLGEEAFAAAWARGEGMTIEEVAALVGATPDAG